MIPSAGIFRLITTWCWQGRPCTQRKWWVASESQFHFALLYRRLALQLNQLFSLLATNLNMRLVNLHCDVCWVLLGRVARHLVQLWGFTNLMLFTTQLLSVLCSKSICCRGAVPINRLTCYSNIAGRNGQVVPCLPVIWDSTVVSHYGHRYNSRCMCILAHRLHTFTALFEPT